MCRHLAYLGPPRSLASLLRDPPHSLERQSWAPKHQVEVTMNADGWGVGWWDHDLRPEPARYRTATPMWADHDFRSVAELTHASAIVAAARAASPTFPVVVTGNAPFTSGPWLFSLNGTVHEFRGAVAERLRRMVSDERAAGIEGTTDTELLFALTLDRMDRGATPSDALLEVLAALGESPGRINLLLSDGHQVAATTFGNSLFTLAGGGLAEGGVLVASEPLDDHEGWAQVPDGSLVTATIDHLDIAGLTTHGGSP